MVYSGKFSKKKQKVNRISDFKIIQNWGFGMAPFKPKIERNYNSSIQEILSFLYGKLNYNEIDLDSISIVKGLLNRCIKKDQ